MGNKIKIHYTFYIFLFFVTYFNGFSLFFSYFIALIIHEYSHYLLSRKYNKMTQSINIYPFGMNVNVNGNTKNNKVNFLIFLIGPLSNILLLLTTTSLWWYCPVLYFYTKNFALANFILGFFNLIPIYPLDGGNMILQTIKSLDLKLKILKLMKIICIVIGCLFLVLFIWSCFFSINFSCFSIAFFMFSSLLSYRNVLDEQIKNKFNNKIKEHKAYVINLNTGYEDIKKCFDDNAYVQFYILNNENKIIKILSQEEVKVIFSNHFNKLIS